jgi:Tol biopolymer transport system component
MGPTSFFYSSGIVQPDLQSFDVTSAKFTPFLPGMHALLPGFSRDGQWVAYLRTTTGSLWRSRLDGTNAREFPFPAMKVGFPRWSPDGKTLAFSAAGVGIPVNAYVLDADGGVPQLLVPSGQNLSDPDWSADGSEMVVEEEYPAKPGKEAGSVLAIVTMRDRHVREIPASDGMGMPRWSPDGRWIAALSRDRRELVVYNVVEQHWRTLLKSGGIGLPVWSDDAAYLYVQRSNDSGQPIDRVKIASSSVETVASFQSTLNTGIVGCVFLALTRDNHPIVDFNRGNSDIYGATLIAP